mmetsp:Transcript_8927/g.22698  ORF Transcript_8927/g.22698 Transcript_8927/m.22698 type:complete len:364 (+) Transcript_8927:73-1164(+)
MGRQAMMVVGPAGSGKSTFCFTMQNHMLANSQRLPPKVINLDPGQERTEEAEGKFPFDLDVRDLVGVADVMEELEFGPNGALVFCMEHLVENLQWLEDGLDEIGGSEDEYFIFDCPGQIELYTHIPVLSTVLRKLQSMNITVCVVHVIDALFIDDTSKFISGALLSLTSMMQLHAPAINVITKCDIKKDTNLGGRERRPGFRAGFKLPPGAPATQVLDALAEEEDRAERLQAGEASEASEGAFAAADGAFAATGEGEEEYLNVNDPEFFNPDPITLRASVASQSIPPKFKCLSESICGLLENYNLVSFVPIDITDEESVDLVLMHIDNATQYGEDLEPRDPRDADEGGDGDAGDGVDGSGLPF